MMPNKGIIFVLAHFLLTSLVLAQSALNLGFFTDGSCSTRSTISPNVTLGLSICAATLGALSIFVPTFPCSGNNVRLVGFSDTSCRTNSGGSFNLEQCYEWSSGGSYGSIVLTCQSFDDESPLKIVSYTTISVGPLAVDATAVPTSNPTSAAFSPTSTASSGTGSTGSTGNSGSSSGTSSSNSNTSSSSGWDAFPIGAKIGIIVGAIVAVAIIIFLGWCIWHRDRRHERMVALQTGYNSGYNSSYNPSGYPQGQGQSVYQPSTYIPTSVPPSAQPLHSPPLMQPGYAPSRYPVTEVDWNQENNQSRYTGSELGASDIASWRDGTHTITAPTQH